MLYSPGTQSLQGIFLPIENTCTQTPERNKERNKSQLCINCDNRHGCAYSEPLCLVLRRTDDEMLLGGHDFMITRKLLAQCRDCDLFRRCWDMRDYEMAKKKKAK